MRLLTVYDDFSRGGLESQIEGQARALASHGVEMFLASGGSVDEVKPGLFKACIGGLSLSSSTSFRQLRETLTQMAEFICAHNITAIHAHPFYSNVVGALVAQATQLPFVLTLHGPVSLTSMKGHVLELLFRGVVLPATGNVFCVSREVELICQANAVCRTHILPNAVQIPERAIERCSSLDGPWMWAGRIDSSKVVGLMDLITKMDSARRQLHIYGDGPAKPDLLDFLNMGGFDFVELRGWNNSLPEIMRDYSLVAGMGRVILEAAARDRACLLVGYDGVKGLLDRQRLEQAGFWNYSGRGFATVNQEQLETELDKGQDKLGNREMSEWVRSERSEAAVWQQFLTAFPVEPTREPTLAVILEALRMKGVSDAEVWNSLEFAELLEGLLSNSHIAGQNSIQVAQQKRDRRLSAAEHALQQEMEGSAALRTALAKAEELNSTLAVRLADFELTQQKDAAQAAALKASLATAEKKNSDLTIRLENEAVSNAQLREQFANADFERNQWEFQCNEMARSTSWRATHPFRLASSAARLLASKPQATRTRLSHVIRLIRRDGLIGALTWTHNRLSLGSVIPNQPSASPSGGHEFTAGVPQSASTLSSAFTMIEEPFDPYALIDPLKPIRFDVINKPFSGSCLPFSCVTTVRNEAESIVEFLDSLAKQTVQPHQLVVVDGGSTDRTIELVRRWSVSAPFEVNLVEAGKVNIARGRNIGVEKVATGIIVFIDAGSVLKPDFCKELVGAFSTVRDLDVACGLYEASIQNEYSKQFVWDFDTIDFSTFLPSARAFAVKTETFRMTNGFPEYLTKTGEDTLFAIQLRQASKHWAVCSLARVIWDAPSNAQQASLLSFQYASGDGESGYGDFRAYPIALARDASNTWLPQTWIDGYLAGRSQRALIEVERRGIDQLVVILSGVPFTDSGGGQRCSQMAMAFARRNCKVVFVNIYPSFEERRKLYFDIDLSLFEFYALRDFNADNLADRYDRFDNLSVMVISEFPHPSLLSVIDVLKSRFKDRITTVYDYIDNWQTSLGWEWYNEAIEHRFIRQSDVLVASAKTLQERLAERSGRNVALIENAVNDRLFFRQSSLDRPSDLPKGRNIVLYTGAMWGDWFDWDLLCACAKRLPSFDFVMVGGVNPARQTEISQELENVHFLGLKPQRELPAYLLHANVGIIPFIPGDVTNFVNPLKVYEYVAMGLPVVATQMAGIPNIPGVSISRSVDGFADAIKSWMEINPPREEMERFTKSNNWDTRILDLLGLAGIAILDDITNSAPANPNDNKKCWPGVLDLSAPVSQAAATALSRVGASPLHEAEFEIFRYFTRPNDLILDVGANSGQSIVSIRTVAPFTPIKAFEPNTLLAPILEEVATELGSVEIFDFGLGAEESERTLFTPIIDGYAITPLASMDLPTLKSSQQLKYMRDMASDGRVMFLRSNSVVRPGDSLDLKPTAIKIDVEGFEREVVRGLMRTLRTSKALLLVEKSRSILDVGTILREIGYIAMRLQKDGRSAHILELSNAPAIPLNVVFAHEDQLDELASRGLRIQYTKQSVARS